MLGLGLELPVGDGASLERPDAPDSIVRLSEHDLSSRPTATSSREVPTNAISIFVRTLTGSLGDGMDERVVDRRRSAPTTRGSCSFDKTSDFQDGRSADHVRDQPLPVDPSHVEVGRRGSHDLARVGIHEMALEVEGAPILVDRDLELVRRVV